MTTPTITAADPDPRVRVVGSLDGYVTVYPDVPEHYNNKLVPASWIPEMNGNGKRDLFVVVVPVIRELGFPDARAVAEAMTAAPAGTALVGLYTIESEASTYNEEALAVFMWPDDCWADERPVVYVKAQPTPLVVRMDLVDLSAED